MYKFHNDEKFEISIADENNVCVKRKNGVEMHFDFERNTLTTFTSDRDMSIQNLDVICRKTSSTELHESEMLHKEKEAHYINEMYSEYLQRLN